MNEEEETGYESPEHYYYSALINISFDFPLVIYVARPSYEEDALVNSVKANGFVDSFDDNAEVEVDDGTKTIESIVNKECFTYVENDFFDKNKWEELNKEEKDSIIKKLINRTFQSLAVNFLNEIYKRGINPSALKETIYEQIKKHFMCAVKVTVKSHKEWSETISDVYNEFGWNINYYSYNSNNLLSGISSKYNMSVSHPLEIGCYTYRPILSDGDLEIVSDKSTD